MGCATLIVLIAMNPIGVITGSSTTNDTTPTPTQPTQVTPTPTLKKCPPVHASFTTSILDYDPFQVTFIETNGTVPSHVRRRWDFGDGNSSTEERPVHTYASPPKPYTVTLTVWNACNESNTSTLQVYPDCNRIVPEIVAYPRIGTVPLRVSFTDTSPVIKDGYTWKWAFGDGEMIEITERTKRNVSHTYYKPGIYFASLTISNRCRQSQSAIISINAQVKGTISGRLWLDENVNETIDPGESNLSGWQIYLEHEEDGVWKPIQATLTDSDGRYQFSILDYGGVYRIREDLKPGFWITTGYGDRCNISESFALFESDMQFTKNFGHKKSEFKNFHDITLTSSGNATISKGSFIQWVQRGMNGYAIVNETRYELRNEDRCAIYFNEKSRNAHISLAGDIHADNLGNVSLVINGILLDNGFCHEIVSPMIERYHSDLDAIIETEKNSFCSLIWDRNYTTVDWKKELVIHDIIPQEVKRMNITLDMNSVFIHGRARAFEQQ